MPIIAKCQTLLRPSILCKSPYYSVHFLFRDVIEERSIALQNASGYWTYSHFVIKKHCYSVTMAITNFLRVAFNRTIHGELIDIKFDDFG